MSSSVLLIGAGGALGGPLVQEFAKHLKSFSKVAILTQKEKMSKFDKARDMDFDIVLGSILEANSYRGLSGVHHFDHS